MIPVKFSDGSRQWIGRLTWGEFVERTRDKLRKQGKSSLEYKIHSYGVFFGLMEEEVRVPVATAFYEAVLEVQEEYTAKENRGIDTDGPDFGNLVQLIERELDIDRQESGDSP